MRASAGLMPMWRWIQRPILGPSMSRKKEVKAVKPRNTTIEVRPAMPPATPWSRVRPICGTASLMCWAASGADVIPRSWAQLCTRSSACVSAASIDVDWDEMPPSTSPIVITPMATSPSMTTAAPAARGHPRRSR